MAISNLLTGRVRVVSPKNVTADRYQFIDLSQVEPNLGVPDFSASLLTNPAIVVSDDQGNRGFVRSLDLDRVTAKFTGSFTGSFTGDGSELFNLPAASKIASGSATASFVDGNLVVNTNTTIQGNLNVKDSIFAEQLIVSYISSSVIYSSGSNKFGDDILDIQQITGSLNVSGSVTITGSLKAQEITGSISGSFTGDGAGLFNIPRSAFSGDASRIASGSVTASVNPQYGFRVESAESGSEFTGSIDVSGSVRIPSGSGFFSGSGAQLFDIPESALSFRLNRIASGSATASISPNLGLVVNTTITASMYSGSGRGLFDIPRSAITEDSFRIASGSVTASVSPSVGFKVESVASGSQFSGSLFIAGNVQLGSGSYYSGSGEKLFNIPRSALTPDALVAALIASGSVTASTTPDYGFQVLSWESGSQFTGSLFVSGARGIELTSGSSYSGSGERLFNIPVSALRDLDLTRIRSGSATASISPDKGFVVNTFSTFSGSVIISASAQYYPSESIQTVFNVTNNSSTSYVFSGAAEGDNQTLTLVRGITYTFNVNATGHPFYIKTTQSSGTGNAYNTGVTNNGDDNGIISFTVPNDAPNTLYYNCQFHLSMGGQINIVDGFLQRGPGVVISGSLDVSDIIRAREFTGSFSASYIQGDGSGLFNIPRSAFTGDSPRIASGSVTASVSPNLGFIVKSAESGSEFTGSLNVSGSVKASEFSGSFSGSFQGDGSRLTGIIVPPPIATAIVSGSVTASVSPDSGFIVTSIQYGSTLIGNTVISGSLIVSGNIELLSGSSYSGSGARLFNIPRTALTPDALLTTEIKSGSVTASVSPNIGFVVTSVASGSQFSGSLFVSGAGIFLRSGSFSGSGKNLFDIPLSAISDLDTSKIFSGSVTASVSPNFGFVVTSPIIGSKFTGSLFVSGNISASLYRGDGSGLFNIPFSALSEELKRIASGSVTASVSPNDGFRVISLESGSQFTGSLFVSGGNIRVATGSFFSGSGAGLSNIPRNALTEDALTSFEIKSGSVTASVSPNFGFKVQSATSGSQFTGSLKISGSITLNSGSAYSGSGRNLFDIPESALAFRLNRIFSGSATASISPDRGFEVNVFSTISGSFIVSSSAREIASSSLDTVFNVVNDGSNAYWFSGAASGSNIPLT